jgi:hypothetical protein
MPPDRRASLVAILAFAALLAAAPGAAAGEGLPPRPDPSGIVVPESAEVAPRAWEFQATVFGYHGNGEAAYAYATFLADREHLHLEARWAYEDRKTASVWAGWNFEAGRSLALEATPMVGGVFGETNGVAVGLEATLAWRRLELYVEAEYLFDLDDRAGDYGYAWTELSYHLNERWRVGLVAQRTRAWESDLEVDPGVLVGLSIEEAEVSAYVIDVGLDEPMVALSLSVGF